MIFEGTYLILEEILQMRKRPMRAMLLVMKLLAARIAARRRAKEVEEKILMMPGNGSARTPRPGIGDESQETSPRFLEIRP